MPYLAAGLEGVDDIRGELDGAATVLSELALCLSSCRLSLSFFHWAPLKQMRTTHLSNGPVDIPSPLLHSPNASNTESHSEQ